MPTSERVLEKLGKPIVVFSDDVGSPLLNEEFYEIEKNPQWNMIKSLTFSNISSLTSIPKLPIHLNDLVLRDTSIQTLPILPSSLKKLELIKNVSLLPPEMLSKKLSKIILKDNNFKILPQLPFVNKKKITIEENALEEPFLTLYNKFKVAQEAEYMMAYYIFMEYQKGIWELIQTRRNRKKVINRARDVLSTKLTMSRTNKIPVPVNRLIASYLSGKSEKKSLEQQLNEVHSNYLNIGGSRKERTRKRKIKKIRKTRSKYPQ